MRYDIYIYVIRQLKVNIIIKFEKAQISFTTVSSPI